MLNYLLIGLGAAIGGVLRFWLSNYTYKFLPETFPYGTLFVNVSGSFILGLIIFYFSEKELLSAQLRIFLAIGFCGGFTTFSTFSLETINLLRESQYLFSFLNIMLNIFLCLLGMYLAYLLTKILG